MVLTSIIVGAFLLGAVLFLWSILSPALKLKGREPQAVDLSAYLNLLDPGQLDYLRQHTSGSEFRTLLRARRRALAAYLQHMAQNSALALRAADTVLVAAPAPEMEAAARRVAEAALAMRTYAVFGLFFLRFGSFLPGEAAWLRKAAIRYRAFSDALGGQGRTVIAQGL